MKGNNVVQVNQKARELLNQLRANVVEVIALSSLNAKLFQEAKAELSDDYDEEIKHVSGRLEYMDYTLKIFKTNISRSVNRWAKEAQK